MGTPKVYSCVHVRIYLSFKPIDYEISKHHLHEGYKEHSDTF